MATERYIERWIGNTHENFIVQYFKFVELIKFGLAETVPLKIAIFASLMFLSQHLQSSNLGKCTIFVILQRENKPCPRFFTVMFVQKVASSAFPFNVTTLPIYDILFSVYYRIYNTTVNYNNLWNCRQQNCIFIVFFSFVRCIYKICM